MDNRLRCVDCGSDRCHGTCSPRAARIARERIVAFLREKKHPLADRWADEIERGDHEADFLF